jgi:hypothetical protein
MDDRSMVVPGAIFDWSIGYRQDEGGTRTRVSRLVFRRLPAWSKDRIQKHKLETDEMYRYFNDAAGR